MKQKYKLLKGGIVIIILLVLFDRGLGNLCQYMYSSSKYGIFARQNHCFNEPKEDILILGSSRAAHHYIPSIFQDSLNMTCYNAGSDGMCIYYHYVVLASWIKKHKPKLVLCDLTESDLLASKTSTFTLEAALERLAPHYGICPEVDSLCSMQGWREIVKMHSMLYRYNSKLLQIVKSNFIYSYENAGYEPLYGSLPDSTKIQMREESSMNFEKSKILYFDKLIQLTKMHNIKMILLCSPTYGTGNFAVTDTIQRIADKNKIYFWNEYSIPMLMCPKYFKDQTHLNDEGARVYSQYISERIKNIE